ncbi:MAG TPA: aspartyl/asparaginyl beta-hydroxylase domain-containing protein [Allosphingosinicella sp.]
MGEAELFARASEAWHRGRPDEASKLLRALVDREPGHAAALNTLGMIALNKGDCVNAISWLEQAAAAAPETAPIRFNLFQALDRAGEAERALAALDAALCADPNYLPANIMKADLLERLGRGPESLALFRALIASDAPIDVMPEPVVRAFARGRERVRADGESRAAALEAPLAAVQAAWPGADLSRARAYAEQRTGRRRIYVQQPVGGHFPYLPALEFFPRDLFPWLGDLEAKTAEIAAELLAVIQGGAESFRPYVGFDPTMPVNQWAELNHSRRWSAFFFLEDGERHEENIRRCPGTASLLESLPLLDLPGKGPTAMFSILEPNTRIPPHTGSNNVRATIHLPLIVPQGCGFRVGAETRAWEVGKAWAFDDTIEHEAWNQSGEPRAILILDAWNPLLSEAERAAVRLIG